MRILIVEDEHMVAKALSRMTREIIGPDLRLLETVLCVSDAEEFLTDHEVDVLMLDLNLGGESGFELLAGMVARNFQTIIVSANTDQALTAFEYGVVDFVAKPFTEERLKQALGKLGGAGQGNKHTGAGKAQFLGVRHAGKTQLIQVADIVRLKADDKYCEIILKNGSNFFHEKSLGQLMLLLPDNFQRIHKSHGVNLLETQALKSFPGSKYELQCLSGEHVPVGRSYLSALRERVD